MATRTCGGCGRPADWMRAWGTARIPICAGCDEVLDTLDLDAVDEGEPPA